MVHRHIKPGNILLDREHERALIAYFGLVKAPVGGESQTVTKSPDFVFAQGGC